MVATPNKERAALRTTMDHASAAAAAQPPETRRCVVVGATARAFVASAVRAGWAAHAADLFADDDLAATAAEVVRLGPGAAAAYPDGIPDVVAAFPEAPCVYTGGLENHPDVIAAIASLRPLAGCSADAVRRARDPAMIAAIVREAGLHFPEWRVTPSGLPRDGSFVVKPRRSAGGRGVRRWRGGTVAPARGDCLWQRFVPGESRSASYVARAGQARLVGASRQLAGLRWCGARTFAYCGSVDVPLDSLSDRLRGSLERVGRALAAALGLEGLFGVDLIMDSRDGLHVLEINPRPTASLELVERATGWSVAAAHLSAFGWCADPPQGHASPGIWAKAIAYAPRGATADAVAGAIADCAARWASADGLPAIADVPGSAEPPRPGAPLMTVFARGDTSAAALAALRRRVCDLRRLAVARVSPRAAAPSASRRRRGSTA